MRHNIQSNSKEWREGLTKISAALKQALDSDMDHVDYIKQLDEKSKVYLGLRIMERLQSEVGDGKFRESPIGIYNPVGRVKGFRVSHNGNDSLWERGDVTYSSIAISPPEEIIRGRSTNAVGNNDILKIALDSRDCGSSFDKEEKISDKDYGAIRLVNFKVSINSLNNYNSIQDTSKVFKTFDEMQVNDEFILTSLRGAGLGGLAEAIERNKFFKVLRANKIAPEWFILMSKHESGLIWDRVNKAGTDRVIAYGLIQFTRIGAKSIGATLEGIMSMDIGEQLAAIVKFYNNLNKSGLIDNFGKMKIANFMPAALKWSKDTVMFLTSSTTGKQNPNTDYDKDGYVTVSDTVIRSYEFCGKLLKGKEGWFQKVVSSVLK